MTRRTLRLSLLLVALLGCLVSRQTVTAEGPAHPHQGVVVPFQAGDPGVKLDGKATSLLSSGLPFSTQIQSAAGGRGLVVQDIQAPTSIVWDRILDFGMYSKMVPKTYQSSIYKREKAGGSRGAERIWVRLQVGFQPAPKLVFYINHLYQPALNSMTWTLDYGIKSDFDDSCGYWYVVPHPENPKWSRVYYSVEVSMFSWVPKFVMDFMSKQALTDATGWVKKVSELEYAKQAPAATATGATAKPKRRGFFRKLFRRPLPKEDVVVEEEVSSTKASPASLTRYVLASTAVALLGCNIYLFVAQ